MNANIQRCSSYNDEHRNTSFQKMVTHNANSGTADDADDDDKSLSSICTLDVNNFFGLLDHQGVDHIDHTGHFILPSTLERQCEKIDAIIAASCLNHNDHTSDWTRHLLQSFDVDRSEMLQDIENTSRECIDDDADAESSVCQDSIKVTIRRRSNERRSHVRATST